MAMDLMPINIYIYIFFFLYISLVEGSFEKKTLGSIYFFSLPFKSFGIIIFILLFLKLVS